MPQLPAEIIIDIIHCLIPSSTPVAFGPSDPITRTLYNLTKTSRLTSFVAQQLLLKHCLYINTSERFWKVISPEHQALPNPAARTASQPPPSTGLFLSPIPYRNTLEDHLEITKSIDTLLYSLRWILTRLIIDLPLRSLYPEDDKYQVRPRLRAAFSSLTALEEFCSVQDELYISTMPWPFSDMAPFVEPEVWSTWPRLRRLALYNVDVAGIKFLPNLEKCKNLTHLVLARADGLYEQLPEKSMHWYRNLPKLKRVALVDTKTAKDWEMRPDAGEGTFAKTMALASGHDVKSGHSGPLCTWYSVEVPPTAQDDIRACQDYLCRAAMNGSLWESGRS